ncbi:MAG: MBL fold metallo-hydrolase [Rubrivivax sp.]
MKLQFLGAVDGVTGSRHRVDIGGERLLLDCGMFQGFKVQRERNWAPLPPALLEADAVILSHAHLDHSGFLPALVKQGWRGAIYATPATCDLAGVLLMDAAHLQEEDARRANRYGYSRHAKALPLYTRADALRAIARLRPLPTGVEHRIGGVGVTLTPAGHLLGACSVTLAHGGGERLVFSGDLGRSNDLLMPPPEPVKRADVLIVESTYGNRAHPQEDVAERLAAIVRSTVERGGSVLLPSFAVGRAQALLLLLQRLRRSGAIPQALPIFVDSPMALEATALYRRHAALLRVAPREMKTLTDGVTLVATVQQSMRLSRSRWPSVIISASGMATGGRVLHHLKALLPDARHHVCFPGFQVGGSRGARLVAGATDVKIHGEYVPVRAEVSHLASLSGHADSDELLAWVRQLRQPPRQTYVVHGEPDAADALRVRIADELRWPVRVPQLGEVVDGA